MRMPPLPEPSPEVTEEWLRQRNAGGVLPRPAGVIEIRDYDLAWPEMFAEHEKRLRTALGPAALLVEHVGSTSVPGLAAKPRIDVDVIVADPADEPAYLPALEAAGYVLRVREPDWYEHRCLHGFEPTANVHVFGPDCDEFRRHVIFRDWLRDHPADRERYAAEKRRIAAAGVTFMAEYAAQKSGVVIDILRKAGLTVSNEEKRA
ncbi:GrpB family protein [Hamadaea sp. NPDC051192]|uniref:GrpB family protein n=1 Tax=Hamadaea sp. NPDC051192 TaxID=3154940 RepID=UPI0034330321